MSHDSLPDFKRTSSQLRTWIGNFATPALFEQCGAQHQNQCDAFQRSSVCQSSLPQYSLGGPWDRSGHKGLAHPQPRETFDSPAQAGCAASGKLDILRITEDIRD